MQALAKKLDNLSIRQLWLCFVIVFLLIEPAIRLLYFTFVPQEHFRKILATDPLWFKNLPFILILLTPAFFLLPGIYLSWMLTSKGKFTPIIAWIFLILQSLYFVGHLGVVLYLFLGFPPLFG
jgi:magnesium-transporting ATPase (P-type)